MKKGGRCSTATALGASLLKLHPCLDVVDGKLPVTKKYRGSIEKVVEEYVRDRLRDRTDPVSYTHLNTTSFVQMEDAVNARGLAIGLTSVYTPRPRPGLNAGMVLRLLAETCAAVPEALDRLRALPQAACQTLTLADAGGDIAVAECSPDGMRVERPGPAGPFVCAANLFHSDLAVPLPPGLDSWRAAERYDTCLLYTSRCV